MVSDLASYAKKSFSRFERPKLLQITLVSLLGLCGPMAISIFYSPVANACSFSIVDENQYPRPKSSGTCYMQAVSVPAGSNFWANYTNTSSSSNYQNLPMDTSVGATDFVVSHGYPGGSTAQPANIYEIDGITNTYDDTPNPLNNPPGDLLGHKDIGEYATPSCPDPSLGTGNQADYSTNACWQASRNNGGTEYSSYEVVVNGFTSTETSPAVDFYNLCRGIHDTNGWEDHTYDSPNNPLGNLTVNASTQSQGCGSSRNINGDITVYLNSGDFTSAPELGANMYKAILTIK